MPILTLPWEPSFIHATKLIDYIVFASYPFQPVLWLYRLDRTLKSYISEAAITTAVWGGIKTRCRLQNASKRQSTVTKYLNSN